MRDDAGFVPSRTDVVVALGPEPRATFTGVAPGTYYVRVRGANLLGGGSPSPEILVTVR